MHKILTFSPVKALISPTIALGLLTLIPHSAQAGPATGLVVNIVGIPGAGTTTWTFSGSSTASTTGALISNTAILISTSGNPYQWRNIGDYVNSSAPIFDDGIFNGNGSATVNSASGGTRQILGVLIDRDGNTSSTNNDDWSIFTDADLGILQNDDVSWTGSFSINVDINNFFLGTFGAPMTIGAPGGLLDTQLTFATPEPLTLLGAGAAVGLGTFFKRHSQKNNNRR